MKRQILPMIAYALMEGTGGRITGDTPHTKMEGGLPAQEDGESDEQFKLRQLQHPQMRPPSYQRIRIAQALPYTRKGNNKVQVSFNQGAFHLSMAQLQSQYIFNPLVLQGEEMEVDFFQPGEMLRNGSIVTTPNKIVNRFIAPQDKESNRAIQQDFAKERLTALLGIRPLPQQAPAAQGSNSGADMNGGTNNTSNDFQLADPSSVGQAVGEGVVND